MITPIPPDGSPVDYFHPAAADIENYVKDGKLISVSLFTDGEDYDEFPSWGDWLHRVEQVTRKKPHNRVIWAHNGGNYDWQHLLSYIEKERPDIRASMIMSGSSGVCASIHFHSQKYTVYLNDSARLLPMPLAKLQSDLALPTGKLDIGDILPEVLYRDNPSLYHEYLRADTITASLAVETFWKIANERILPGNPIRKIKRTLAANAMQILRLGFLDRPVMTTWNKKIRQWERQAAHGGLVLCPNNGVWHNAYGYDVVSEYPSIMSTLELPDDYHIVRTKRFIPGVRGIYYVRYETYDDIAWIYNSDNHFSKNGNAYITDLEFSKIWENGKAEVIEGFYYTSTSLWLKPYADTLFSLKNEADEQGNKSLRTVAKLLNNSLAGKFNQGDYSEKFVTATDEIYRKSLTDHRIRLLGGEFAIVPEYRLSEFSFPAVNAFITAGGRCKIIDAVRENRDTFLYADTDSMITTGEAKGLVTGSNLGNWKQEFENAEVGLLGRKTYFVVKDNGAGAIEKIRTKGIPLSKIADKGQREIYQRAVIERMRKLALEPGATEVFMFREPPTNYDVFVKGKVSGLWIEKYRTMQATSDRARSNNDTLP